MKSKLCLDLGTFRMASQFEEERFFLVEKNNRMVTVTPFMGILKVHIRQFYVNEKGEKKPGKNGITLELEEFGKLVKLVPKAQDSIARYDELRDTGIPSSPFEPDLPVLDLDTVFLPSPQSQEPIPIIRDKELLDSQLKCPSPPLLIERSLENELYDLDLYSYLPGERRKRENEPSKWSNKKPKIENSEASGIFVGYAKLPSQMKEEQHSV